MNPVYLNQWFSQEKQYHYISKLTGRLGLTRRRAEYFVRLWAYLLLKQQQELGKRSLQPLMELSSVQGAIPCTHREAAELFYAQKDRGSDRSAGMMIDQFVALGLIKKKFDGNTICIQLRPLPELTEPVQPQELIQLECDTFNPRTDAVPAANLSIRNYSWLDKQGISAHKMARLIRDWAQQYPTGMRVLRRCDNHHLVGFFILYPTAIESEANFFLPPSQSIYLVADTKSDPIQMAIPGDRDCSSVFIRAFRIDVSYLKPPYLCQLVEDLQRTLKEMRQDFPHLYDLYGIVLHPIHEALRLVLGFQKTLEDTEMSLYWIYQSVDQFLALDVPQALARLKIEPSVEEF